MSNDELIGLALPARNVADIADAIWAAGFMDGEGCVNLTQGKRSQVVAQVLVMNTNVAVLEWHRARWGGGIYKHGKLRSKWDNRRRLAFTWTVWGQKALPFLEDVLPHLKIKQRQTENAIAFLQLKSQRKKFKRLTETERAEDAAFLAAHRALDLTRGGQKAHRTSAEVRAELGPEAQWS